MYALWTKDKVCYSGHVTSVTSDRQAVIAFDDGNSLSVQLDRILVCDLLPVGTSVLAQRGDDELWSELATVLGHYHSGTEKGHLVQFATDKHQCQ